MPRTVNLKFKDAKGNQITRSSGLDLESLHNRCIDVLLTVPGFHASEELGIWLGTAKDAYEGGWYEKALKYLNMSLEKLPDLEPYIFYYIRICKRVLAVPLKDDEKKYELERNRYVSRLNSLPRWLWWIVPTIQMLVRCKWCGRYTRYVSPNGDSFGFIAGGVNSCSHCGMSYPMPSWMWDSPDGRAYSYYRKSFPPENKQFYEEFLEDYHPIPTVEKSGLFK